MKKNKPAIRSVHLSIDTSNQNRKKKKKNLKNLKTMRMRMLNDDDDDRIDMGIVMNMIN